MYRLLTMNNMSNTDTVEELVERPVDHKKVLQVLKKNEHPMAMEYNQKRGNGRQKLPHKILQQTRRHGIGSAIKTQPTQVTITVSFTFCYSIDDKYTSGFGMSPDHNRILRVETQIARSAIKRMVDNGGVYLPPDIVQERHVFFAVDNVYFAEDTIDGTRTLHGAAMAIYQISQLDDRKLVLVLDDPVQSRSTKELLQSVTELMDFPSLLRSHSAQRTLLLNC